MEDIVQKDKNIVSHMSPGYVSVANITKFSNSIKSQRCHHGVVNRIYIMARKDPNSDQSYLDSRENSRMHRKIEKESTYRINRHFSCREIWCSIQ